MTTAHEQHQWVPQFEQHDRMRKTLDVTGIGVQEMAKYLGVSRNTIGNWISGKIDPPNEQLARWADIVNVPLEWLEYGDEPHGVDRFAGRKMGKQLQRALLAPPAGFEPAAFCSKARSFIPHPSGLRLIHGHASTTPARRTRHADIPVLRLTDTA